MSTETELLSLALLVSLFDALQYAVAIGKVKETVVNINYVVEKLLPPIAATTTSYPDAFLSVWIDALDVLTYCGSAADPAFTAAPSGSTAPQVHQFSPNVVLLEFSARILEMDGLRNLVYSGCSVELRAKVRMALGQLDMIRRTHSLLP